MAYTSKTSTEIKSIIGELEDLLYEYRNVSDGEKVDYNGTEYEMGNFREQAKKDIQYWERKLDVAEKSEGIKPSSYWASRAEGWR